MSIEQLAETAQAMVAAGKGIIAIDESNNTIAKRFAGVGIENSEEHRRAYRELLLGTPKLGEYISGAILYDETIRQSTRDGVPFTKLMMDNGIIPGIKVDKGTYALAGCPGEVVTEGLDGLRDRLKEYYQLGARFAKWRAVINIGDDIPSGTCIEANSHALARYAALCQEQDIVPIVEPEVLMDADNTIEVCEDVTSVTLQTVFDELYRQKVALEGIILKPNMVIAGKKCPKQAGRRQVAEATLRTLKRHVPALVPGIAFLSGGQSDEDATAHLDEMNKMGGGPWVLSFSYGRALQAAALKAWSGRKDAVAAGQTAYIHRAKMNGLAALGEWKSDLEKKAA